MDSMTISRRLLIRPTQCPLIFCETEMVGEVGDDTTIVFWISGDLLLGVPPKKEPLGVLIGVFVCKECVGLRSNVLHLIWQSKVIVVQRIFIRCLMCCSEKISTDSSSCVPK